MCVVHARDRVWTYRKNLQRVHQGTESEPRSHLVSNVIDRLFSELDNVSALDANQVIVVGHPRSELKMRTIALKPMLHQNTALRKQVQSTVYRGPGNVISLGIHIHIELVRTEVSVEFCYTIQHLVPLLSVAVFLPFQEFGELLL